MSEWNFDTLLIYINSRFDALDKFITAAQEAQDKASTAALSAQKEAILKAEAATDKHFASVNEFRAQSAQQQATYLTIAEFQAEMRAIRSEMEAIIRAQNDNRDRITRSEGKISGSKDSWGYVLAIGGFIIGAIGVISRFL